MSKDYYKILNISKDASEDEIKKTYRKLALLYHPDKNLGNDEACEKFKEIGEAYSILGNVDKKKQYDLMGMVDENFMHEDPFSVFNQIFQQHMGSFMNMKYDDNVNIGNIFSNVSGMPNGSFPFGNVHVRVHTFPTDVFQNNIEQSHNFEQNEEDIPNIPNISNIFNNIFKNKDNKKNGEIEMINGKPDNITYNIDVSFAEIYNFKKKKLTIIRNRIKNGLNIEKKKKIEIPIYDKEILLENEGHEFKNYKEKGDIIINIFNKKNKNFKRINDYDILTYKDILLNQFYSAFIFEIKLPNGEKIKIQTEKMNNDNFLIQKISKKGLPYQDENKIICYGNLYILYKIILPEKLEDLKNITEIIEDLPINNEYHTAYNCNLDEIFKND